MRHRGRFIVAVIATALIAVLPVFGKPAGAAITKPTTGTLTVHDGNGGVETNAPAICLNNWIAALAGRAAPCIEVSNSDGPSTGWRYGVYYLDKLEFDSVTTFTTGTLQGDDLAQVVSKTCTDNNQFVGMPVAGNFYGEKVFSTTSAEFARYDGGQCTALSGSHTLTASEWLTPTITCDGFAASFIPPLTVTNVGTEGALHTAVANGDQDICLTNSTTAYTPTSTPLIMQSGTKGIIGDPLQRPVIDVSGLTTEPTVGISAGGVHNATIANVVVEGAQRCITTCSPPCGGCGMGIYANTGLDIYNVLAENNAINGVNAHSFTLEDSAIVQNGTSADLGNTAGGVKSSHAYKAIWNFVDDNTGVGLWCDVGCKTDELGGAWLVHRNYIRASVRGGIREEISGSPTDDPSGANADIAYNYLVGNVTDDVAPIVSQTEHGGIEGIDVQHMLVQYNTFLANSSHQYTGEKNQANLDNDFVIANDGRTPHTDYVRFQNNTLTDGSGFVCNGSPNFLQGYSYTDIHCS